MPSRRRILLVDDESNARNALAELLRDENFDVDNARNGADALHKMAGFQPQVVITDLDMPGMDGIELVRRLQNVTDAPVVIALTAFGQISRALAALHAGATSYLTKPIRFDELLVILAKALRRYDMELERPRLRQHAPHTMAS